MSMVKLGLDQSDLLLIAVGAGAGLVTMVGGAIALRFRSSIELLKGLSGGALIGVALFDLSPEALALGRGFHIFLDVIGAMAAGFAAYFAIGRASGALTGVWRMSKSHLAPASLTLHSLLDGLGIGLAFHVSSATGLIVAGAVFAHDLVDGVNCVTVSLLDGADHKIARRWLLANALAPLIGIGLARLVWIPQSLLAICLGIFSGFLLYIGANTVLRPLEDRRPRLATTITPLIGLAMVYSIVRLSALR